MSRSKRKKQSAAQQKAANVTLANRDLKKKPLTATEIIALPRDQRPPRSEWPDGGVGNNPRPYPNRRKPMERSWFVSGGGGSSDFASIIGFLILWAVCAFVEYGALNALGMMSPYTWISAIIIGLFSALIVLGMLKGGGSGGFDVTHRW